MSDPFEVLKTALKHRYVVERQLGSGGMAIVYLARDLKYDRTVAIKVLRPELAPFLGAERFLREIRISAQLQHPHILPLLESGVADGLFYYVMPYVEGESLRARLKREGPLPLDDALRIGVEVGDALSHAHAHGVVHRDIKPENILLSGGHALVADFGLARAISSAGEQITSSGLAVGTPAYMSPEQASASGIIDARSDIYSLGCVMYEMLAGEPPYTGSSAQTILARKMAESAPALRAVRDSVPPAVEEAVMKAVARVPADRFATTEEFVAALSSTGAGRPRRRAAVGRMALAGAALAAAGAGWWIFATLRAPAAERGTVAVLPCENLARDPEQVYVSDQVTEEIIGRLSAVKLLRVKSWLATQQYRNPDRSAADVARELGVSALVRCGVRQGDGQVEIQAQLIDARRDQVLWADGFRRPLSTDEILQVENAIAQHVAGALGVDVSPGETSQLARLPTQNLDALNAYRLGRHFWNMRTAEGLMKSIEYYRRAIALDSTFAMAYVGLAGGQAFLGQLAPLPARQFMAEVKRLVLKALALDEAAAEAHAGLGQVLLLYDWDWPSANREFKRALELEPNSAMAHLWYGQSLSYVGRHAEAVAESWRAVELEPTMPFVVDNLAFRLLYAHRYDEALATAQRALELDANHWVAYTVVGAVAAVRGRYLEAIAAMREAFDLSGRSVVPLARLGQVYGMAGQRAQADSVLADLRSRAAAGYVPSTYVALVYAGMGERNQAFAWLAKAYDERDFNLIWYLGGEPTFDGLRTDPRYDDLRQRVGFSEWAPPAP